LPLEPPPLPLLPVFFLNCFFLGWTAATWGSLLSPPDWLLNRHHLVGLGFVGRPKSVRQRRQGADVAALLFAEQRPERLGKSLQEEVLENRL
jgi:hypothetical protein